MGDTQPHSGVDPQASHRRRYRLVFSKDGPARYTSHLDLARVWERLLRRAEVGLSYSQGFTPRAHLHLAAALPLGYASDAELLDLWTTQDWEAGLLAARIQAQCPEGISLRAIQRLPLDAPGLQISLRAGAYRVEFREQIDLDALRNQVQGFLQQSQLLRERRGKAYDLRPLVLALALHGNEPTSLLMTLQHQQERGSGRADEVLDALGIALEQVSVRRTALIFDSWSSHDVTPWGESSFTS